MTVYPMMEASYQQVNREARKTETVREAEATTAIQAREDQEVVKRFLTFSDPEEEEGKRKDSNFVKFARRMSTMVVGEKGRCPTLHFTSQLSLVRRSPQTTQKKSSFSKSSQGSFRIWT